MIYFDRKGIDLLMCYPILSLIVIPNSTVSPAFLFSQRLVPRSLTASPRGKRMRLRRRNGTINPNFGSKKVRTRVLGTHILFKSPKTP